MYLPIHSQGSTGHSLGAAGGFEAVACVKALQSGTIPPTANYETPDPDCDLDYTPNKVCMLLGFVYSALYPKIGVDHC